MCRFYICCDIMAILCTHGSVVNLLLLHDMLVARAVGGIMRLCLDMVCPMSLNKIRRSEGDQLTKATGESPPPSTATRTKRCAAATRHRMTETPSRRTATAVPVHRKSAAIFHLFNTNAGHHQLDNPRQSIAASDATCNRWRDQTGAMNNS